MILTDREWLRFVTFALFGGGTLGAAFGVGLLLEGATVPWAVIGGVVMCGVIALIVHVPARFLIDYTSEPPAEDPAPEADAESETA